MQSRWLVLNIKRLPKLYDPVDFFVAGTPMGGVAGHIVQARVRRYLLVAAATSPCFCSSEQLLSMASAPCVGIDIPRFDVRDGARVTAIRMRTCSNLDKTGQRAIGTLNDEDGGIGPSAKLMHASREVVGRVVREERNAQAEPL